MNTPDDTPETASPETGEAESSPPAKTEVRKPSSETESKKLKKNKKDKPEPTTALGKFWHAVGPIVKVFLVVWLVRTAIIDWNDVPTGSMEPNILVGDRILVNKAAYAFQFPLSGPKIGVPFTQLQWDNPLDFLPQIPWGTPARGDIVTFWNPVTGVRMVKRIVAQPGDTIEMRGGKMIINGQDATYVDVTPFPPKTTKFEFGINAGQGGQGTKVQIEPLESLIESLLDESREIQHIESRWMDTPVFVVFANGELVPLNDQGMIVNQQTGQTVSPDTAAANMNTSYRLLQVRDGATFVDDQPASYNDYAAAYLQPLAGQTITLKDGTKLEVNGHELLVDGQPTSIELFERELKAEFPGGQVNQSTPAGALYVRIDHLSKILLTSFGPVTLGDDQYFMVGDNRQNSHDSRFFGPVDRGEITGEAIAIAASFEGRILQIPPEPRWNRWFSDLD